MKTLRRNLKRVFLNYFFLSILSILAVGCSRPGGVGQIAKPVVVQTAPRTIEELGQAIQAIFDRPDFAGARWGVYIHSSDTGDVVFARNETQTFAPASNEKIFTTVGALLLLGPEFRYATQFYSTGDLGEDGTLHGDLVVQGNGNFWLGSSRPDRDLGEQLAALAAQCRDAGIARIEGGLIGDDTWIDPAETSWRGGSVVMDQNAIHATLSVDAAGESTLEVSPELPGIKVVDQVERIAADAEGRTRIRLRRAPEDSPDYEPDARVFIMTGRIKPGETLTGSGSVGGDDAVAYYLDVLRAAFEKASIAINGQTRVLKEKNDDYRALMDGATFRFQSLSPPLSELVSLVLKPSDNYRAERIFLTCGHDLAGTASLANGEAAVKAVLQKYAGISPANYELEDGSGLSHDNAVRPIDIVAIFDMMRRTSYFPTFYDSLPIAGVDGTLRNRMKDTPAEGNVRAKTGHIRGVTALSGYATSRDGERFTFSMIINDNPGQSSVPDGAENEVCALLAGFSRE